MSYTHYHNWSVHTHHQRPKGGNHDRATRRRQKPWKIAFTMAILTTVLVATILVLTNNDRIEAAKTFTSQMFESESQRQQVRQQTRTANARSEKAAQVSGANAHQEKYERAIVALINQERSQRGAGLLAWESPLQAIARAHAQDMATHNYFSHTNKSGMDYRDRATAAGYRCLNTTWGNTAENIYFGPGIHKTSEATVASWLSSPGHRRAMLHPSFKKAAIGIHEGHLDGYGTGYYTVLLLC